MKLSRRDPMRGFAPKAVGARGSCPRPGAIVRWGKLTFSLRRASLTGRVMALEVGAATGEEVESDMVMMCGFGWFEALQARKSEGGARNLKLDEAQWLVAAC